MNKIKVLSEELKRRKLRIITVESCTGGLFASLLNSQPGSSSFFEFGIICYSNLSKEILLKIPKNMIKKYGAVSTEISNMMSDQIKKIFKLNNHVIISITGIAGPSGGSNLKPVGTTFITILLNKKHNFHQVFNGKNRKIIQNQIIDFSTNQLLYILKNS